MGTEFRKTHEYEFDAVLAGVALRAGTLSSQALTEHALARLAAHDDTLRTFIRVGMQLVGKAFDERTLFRIGAAFEAQAGVTHRRPPLEGGRAS